MQKVEFKLEWDNPDRDDHDKLLRFLYSDAMFGVVWDLMCAFDNDKEYNGQDIKCKISEALEEAGVPFHTLYS